MGDSITKQTVYFSQKGKENTEELARIVAERATLGDISAVAVATSSGYSALTVAQAFQSTGTSATGTSATGTSAVPVFGVNFQSGTKLDDEIQAKAEAIGVCFMPDSPVALYLKDIDGHSPDSFRCFGQGMKVAVEVIMQAVEVGHIEKGERVIGVGGTAKGADVAIVARAAGPAELSSLWISEILAKPL